MIKNRTGNFFSLLLLKCLNPRITRRLFLVFWIYTIWLVAMNLTPGSTEQLEMKRIAFVRMDYFIHAVANMILAIIYVSAAFSPRPVFLKYPLVAGILFLTFIAAFPEWMQNFIPRRRFNWWDMLANFTGLAIGGCVALIVFSIFRIQIGEKEPNI